MEMKPYIKSKTIWGAIIAALPTILRVAGVPLPPILDEAIIQIAIAAMGVALTTKGRIDAKPNLSFRGR